MPEFLNSQRILGDRIREARRAKGWTQEDLADKAQIDRSYVGGIERGERNITFSMLCRVSRVLGCDVGTLTHKLPSE